MLLTLISNAAFKAYDLRISKEFAKLRIGITGSPGTGKKSVGSELAKITGKPLVFINDYAISHGFGKRTNSEFEVDEGRLYGKVPTENSIVVGHLLPYVVKRNQLDSVVVLRCSPATLKKRLLHRGYSTSKLEENVGAEVLGVIPYKALQTFGSTKLSEFDTTRSKPKAAAKKILDTIIGKRPKPFGAIDWLSGAESPRSLMRVLSMRKLEHTVKDN